MNVTRPRVLILGGYGTFGGRLAQLLAGNSAVTLLIAGRSLECAQAFCERLSAGGAACLPARFDRDDDVEAQIQSLYPDWVVDATGPFQCYGENPYRVIKACLALRTNYLDLADGADFVAGVAPFDAQARTRGIVILSGVSSFPVLTAAVLRQLSKGLLKVETVTGGIAPSPYAGVGANVIRAVASYSGKPLRLVRDGRSSFGIALTESKRYTICPPGRLPLRNIRFSLVDVPDLQILPDLWPGLSSVWIGAGTVPEILHRILNGFAWLVRWRLLPSLLPLASIIHWVINFVRWGEHRGGMFVEVTGTDDGGSTVTRSWHLLAEGDDGPQIPSMGCQAIIEHGIAGRQPPAGARPATADLELADYDLLFARRRIYTGTRASDSVVITESLFQRVLGNAWSDLPSIVQTMHAINKTQLAIGIADINRGPNLFARMVAAIVGFPQVGVDVPVSVSFYEDDSGERWTRTFAGRSFTSNFSEGRGRWRHLVIERFGPLKFGLALVVDGQKLRLIVRRWSLWRLPLPAWLAPIGECYETEVDGRFHFNIEIGHRFFGQIVAYRGWLTLKPL